ncbi:MAG TPA: citrate synthase [Steroidobacteraceae bacterium]|nr:citrate synthase [Steroidobacteraceae bacterium]
MNRGQWLDAAAALALLHVRAQTLYANVSRGRIRARPDPEQPRRSLYHAEDVRLWAQRRRGQPRRERVAAGTIAWGDPILPSAISTVAHGRLWYRGQDAVQLSERADLEQVAALLWELPAQPRSPPTARHTAHTTDGGGALQAAYRELALRAGRDAPMYGRAATALRAEAVLLYAGLSHAILQAIAAQGHPRARTRRATSPLHIRLADAWRQPRAADAIRRALVLLADHELNASTFATRVAASTGAALSASVLAGFATLSGPMHGGAAAAIRALVEAAQATDAERAILAALAQGQTLGAFGHPLYPDGDVRAAALLRRLTVPPLYQSLRSAAQQLLGEAPNVDFALCALAAAMRLPADAPFVLFALARGVGWIAHALEQRLAGTLIRPRARYIGAPIESAQSERVPTNRQMNAAVESSAALRR